MLTSYSGVFLSEPKASMLCSAAELSWDACHPLLKMGKQFCGPKVFDFYAVFAGGYKKAGEGEGGGR